MSDDKATRDKWKRKFTRADWERMIAPLHGLNRTTPEITPGERRETGSAKKAHQKTDESFSGRPTRKKPLVHRNPFE